VKTLTEKELESWFCEKCRIYGTYETLVNRHARLGHVIKLRKKGKTFYSANSGNILLNWKGKPTFILPVVANWVDITARIKDYDKRSGMLARAEQVLKPYKKLGKTWQFLNYQTLEGNLENVTSWLSNCALDMSLPITKEDLTKMLFEALENGRFTPTATPNTYIMYLTLSTNLEGKPKDETSEWIVSSFAEIEVARQQHELDVRESGILEKTTELAKTRRAIGDGLGD